MEQVMTPQEWRTTGIPFIQYLHFWLANHRLAFMHGDGEGTDK